MSIAIALEAGASEEIFGDVLRHRTPPLAFSRTTLKQSAPFRTEYRFRIYLEVREWRRSFGGSGDAQSFAGLPYRYGTDITELPEKNGMSWKAAARVRTGYTIFVEPVSQAHALSWS